MSYTITKGMFMTLTVSKRFEIGSYYLESRQYDQAIEILSHLITSNLNDREYVRLYMSLGR